MEARVCSCGKQRKLVRNGNNVKQKNELSYANSQK
jgi:hypothetical protein